MNGQILSDFNVLGKRYTTNQVHFLNGPILSDFTFLEVYWENYINCQMHFFSMVGFCPIFIFIFLRQFRKYYLGQFQLNL
jgi:hypothetical protein